uniref:Fibrinogen C-terminal domain-containing protein n=1 Tax=Magallana gigas TaxID=29159 RepID=A0A8W8N0C1_MAGGI
MWTLIMAMIVGGAAAGVIKLHLSGTGIHKRNKNCAHIKSHRPLSRDGVYTIYPAPGMNKTVFCDMSTDGGGWTVIQRRIDGETIFFRNWKEYKNGFGHAEDKYWLGDSFSHSNNSYFSVRDADNDNHKANCADTFKAGWWFNACINRNLNGKYRQASRKDSTELSWYHWGDSWRSLKSAKMMIRSVQIA